MHGRRLNMQAVEEEARLRCPSSWLPLGESACLQLYFQHLAMTDYAREITQMPLIYQGPIGQTLLITVKTVPQIMTLPKYQKEDFKSAGWKMFVLLRLGKNYQVSQVLTILYLTSIVHYLIDIFHTEDKGLRNCPIGSKNLMKNQKYFWLL